MIDAETRTLAAYLRADLEKIARSANDQLTLIKRSGLPDHARQAEEATIIDEARARAIRRVESTIRQLQNARAEPDAQRAAEPLPEPNLDMTQVIPAVGEAEPVAGGAAAPPPPRQAAFDEESDVDRLNRLLEFVVRQEPRLNWAVADHADGTTVVVAELAHGWIPPGIALPAGVRLLEPARRRGKASALVGATTHVATYAPGDSLRRSAGFATTKSALQPRELPAIGDLGGVLSAATLGRPGLPRMVHAMATAAAGGSRIVDQEVDVLRVHLDTARYRLLAQYPSVDSALLLDCLLLAATEAFAIGDSVSANYHLSWFRELAVPPSSSGG